MSPQPRPTASSNRADLPKPQGGIYRLLTHPMGVGLLLASVTLAAYWPVAGFEFINYDDHEYVSENYHVRAGLTWSSVAWAFRSGYASNWHPLTWLSHMLDAELFGNGPAGPHVTNLGFHITNVILLFLLLKRLTGTTWRSGFVAALFALHPLHVESVAWISERKDVLSTCFGFLSLLCYSCYAQAPAQNSPARRDKTRCYLASLLFFALGLMSKPMLVTWPLAMLLLDWWPLQRVSGFVFRVSSWHRLLVEKVPFLALSAASSVVTLVVQHGAAQSLTGLPVGVRIENALVSYVRYLGKTLWPVNLALPYPHPGSWPTAQVVLAAGLVILASAGALWFGRRRPYWLVGWFWFLGMLVPVIGLVQVGAQSMADRYTYVPLVGVFLILAWGMAELAGERLVLKKVAGAAGILLLVACALSTTNQVGYWRNSDTLFRHAVAATRNNDIAYSNLGNSMLEIGFLDEGIVNLRKALQTMGGIANSPDALVAAINDSNRTNPVSENVRRTLFNTDPQKITTCTEILNNLGTALARKGQVEEGMQYYRAVLQIKPDHALALHNLAFELAAHKQYGQAIELYQAAVRSRPDDPPIRNGLGNALVAAGRFDEAVQQYQEALRLAPDNAETHHNLGLALTAQGKAVEALPHYEAALRLDPKLIEIHNNLGTALMGIGRVNEAIQQFRELLRLQPNHARAHDNLGVALATQGQLAEAETQLEDAIRYDPTNVNTRYNLGNVLASQGKFERAVQEYTEFLRAVPDHAPAHCNLGGVLAELGRREEAIAQFQEALRLDPNHEPAKQQLRALGVPLRE